jgi:addiction module HigA family antidote
MTKLKPIHLGEILREEFMVPFDLKANKLAIRLRVPSPTIYQISKEERGISPKMALRLARFFRTTPEFWVNLQAHYDLFLSKQEAEERIKRDLQPMKISA